jgi:cell division transport system permease protein
MLRLAGYALREAVVSIRRNAIMSLVCASTVALCLFLLAGMLLLSANLALVARTIEEQVEITVYLLDEVSEAEAASIAARLSQLEGVRQAVFVSKLEALERLRQQFGTQQGLLDAVAHLDPLPASIEISLAWPEAAPEIAALAAKVEGVEEVKFAGDIVEKLLRVTRLMRVGGYVLVLALAAATCFLVANTIRLTVFARRREIAIMRLVGATDAFIKGPFAVEGVLLGIAGAYVAALATGRVYGWVVYSLAGAVPFLPLVAPAVVVAPLRYLLLAFGVLIGSAGSLIAVRRFLGVQGG